MTITRTKSSRWLPIRFRILAAVVLLAVSACSPKPKAEWDKEYFDKRVSEIKAGNGDSIQFYDLENTDALLHSIVGLKGVKQVIFEPTDVTSVGIADLAALPDLTKVSFYKVRVTDEWLDLLAACPLLEEIDLAPHEPTRFTIAKLLALPHLRKLRLNVGFYSPGDYGDKADRRIDADLTQLEQATSLEELELVGDEFVDRKPALIALQQKLPNCKITLLVRNGKKKELIPVSTFEQP